MKNFISSLIVPVLIVATALIAAPAPTSYPTPFNTGPPPGTVLTTYTGPTTIKTCGVVLDSVVVNGDLTIRAGNGTHSSSTPCVTIRNSLVNGTVDNAYTGSGFGPVVITDSEVSVPVAVNVAAVFGANVYMWRSYVHGARVGVNCDGYCEIHDSYLLADREFGSTHMQAFLSNGNYGSPMLLDHNSFLCAPTGPVPDGAGCAADVGLFGDFSAITNTTMTNNIFRATSDAYYCLHGPYEAKKPFPKGGNDVISGNVFERGSGKCAGSDAVFDWNPVAGVWCNNTYQGGGNVLNTPDNCSGPASTTTTSSSTTTVAPTTTSTSTTTSTTLPPVTTTLPATTSTTVPPPTTTTTTTVAPAPTYQIGLACSIVFGGTLKCVQTP